METSFFEKVYAVARHIPYGRATSYGAIAKFIGSPKSARMVGYAMNASLEKEDVPAHRVVNINGLLSGKHYFGGTNVMQELLESEGIRIVDHQIQDFKTVLWDPFTDLNQEDFL